MSNPFITILATIAFTVIGQVLTKKGMSLASPMPSGRIEIIIYFIRTMLLNPYVFSGLLMAVFASVCWMATLSKTQLSYAYPFMSLAFPLVLLLSGVLFNESVSLMRWAGMAIIMVGLIVVAKS